MKTTQKTTEIASKALRILVVDDDDNIRLLLQQALTSAGHYVSIEADGDTALTVLERSYFQVVITDICMPDVNGITLLHEIKSFNPLIQVYIMSAFSNSEYVIQCMRGGAYDYFEKPIVIERVLEAMNEASKRATRWDSLLSKYLIKPQD